MKNLKRFLCLVMYIIIMFGLIYNPSITYLRIMGIIGMSAVFYNALKEIESK